MTTTDSQEIYDFQFVWRSDDGPAEPLDILPPSRTARMILEFQATEAEATTVATQLYGQARAAEYIRTHLAFDRLCADTCYEESLPYLAEAHSADTGQHWQVRPITEIPLDLFSNLLSAANQVYWENFEKSYRFIPQDLAKRGIDFTPALQLVETP